MKRSPLTPRFAALAICASACGDGGHDGTGAAVTRGAGGSPQDSGAAASGGAGGAPALPFDAARRVTFDRGPQTDPDVDYQVTLEMDPFVVAPGEEVYKCQSFANPFAGEQVDIKTYDLDMAQGSHHMFLFYQNNAADNAVTRCPQGGLSFAPFTFTAQSPKATQTFPPGVGAAIPPGTGFYMNVHYINNGTDPITGHVQVKMSVAKPAAITQHAGVIFLNNTSVAAPPGGKPYTATQSYTLPQDVNIIWSDSHMHQRATHFVSTASNGAKVFETTDWAEPAPAQFAPPLQLKAGTNLDWTCTYANDTASTLVFGESAAKNIMCIGVSIYYPVKDVKSPLIGALL